MRHRLAVSTAMFLTLVPVTLLVPGTQELVVGAHGGTSGDAHLFMSLNMLAGIVTVPLVMRMVRDRADIRRWVVGALLLDALAFTGMALAPSLRMLFVFRALDGAAHLPAVTLLMVASNRMTGERRGGALGALATAIMIGVAIGSPVGGWLVERDPGLVYLVGTILLISAAATAWSLPGLDAARGGSAPRPMAASPRYRWDRRIAAAWIPLCYGFMDRFSIGIFVSTFTLFLAQVHGLTPAQRGSLIALFMVPFALLCYPAGRLADRIGWFRPMLVGNVLFGLVFGTYGMVPRSWLPWAMLASGVLSALMFTPNLLLISDLAARGAGDGLFGSFQVAGSLGFLCGPMVGGILVASTRGADGTPAYAMIFAMVGVLEIVLALLSWSTLRRLARSAGGPTASYRAAASARPGGLEHAHSS